jgi:uncharacterized membrane-anchored protein YhcB (DUF1043 family)
MALTTKQHIEKTCDQVGTVRLLAAKYGLELALAQFKSQQLQTELDKVNAELDQYNDYVRCINDKAKS